MTKEENNKRGTEYSNTEISYLTIIQDFNNKKANSHATIFVASMFALFTVLSVSTRMLNPDSINPYVFILMSISYFLILAFGLYSALNFTYYSSISQEAEEAIVCGFDKKFINQRIVNWRGTRRIFAGFKVPAGGQGWLRRKLDWFIIIGYLLSGILPFVAFLIWLFN